MRFFYLMVVSICLLYGKEAQSVIDDCVAEEKNLIGNQLDLGQKYCDSNQHIKSKDLKPAEIENEDLKKFQEFVHSFDCDTRKC